MKWCLLSIISVATLLIFAAPSCAAENFDPFHSGVRMLWGLLIVLAIIYGLYAFLKKRVSALHQQEEGLINIVDVKHILPKKTLMVVEVRGKEFLVGGGSDTITTIVPLDAEKSGEKQRQEIEVKDR